MKHLAQATGPSSREVGFESLIVYQGHVAEPVDALVSNISVTRHGGSNPPMPTKYHYVPERIR